MENFPLLMAIALAAAIFASVESNPLSRDERAVTVKAKAATPAQKAAAPVKNQVAAPKKPVAPVKNSVSTSKTPVVTAPKPTASVTTAALAAPTIPVMSSISSIPGLSTIPVMPSMPPMPSLPNPVMIVLPPIVGTITEESAKSNKNPTLNNFINAISKTKATADSGGVITVAQQDIFVNDLVKSMAEFTGVPKSVQDEVLANVKKDLGTGTPNVMSIATVVGQNADSLTNKATGATVIKALWSLVPEGMAMGLAPMVNLA